MNKSGTKVEQITAVVCSRFVHALFSDVNKSGTNHEHPKCCKIVTLLHIGHRPSVAKLSHCCRSATLLQDCYTVADRSQLVNGVYLVANGEKFETVCVRVDTTFIPCTCTV